MKLRTLITRPLHALNARYNIVSDDPWYGAADEYLDRLAAAERRLKAERRNHAVVSGVNGRFCLTHPCPTHPEAGL